MASRATTSSSRVSSDSGDKVPLSVLELGGVFSPIPRTIRMDNRVGGVVFGDKNGEGRTWEDEVGEKPLRQRIQF